MKHKFLTVFLGCFAAFLLRAFGDGFIVVPEPTRVPPGHFPFAPLEVTKHQVEVKIEGQVATTTVDQEFSNPNNQRLEGIYLFPVPKGAQIEKFSMEIGGKMADAELLPADKARPIYEEIVRKMRDPALLEYAGRDVFKVRVYPIEPHGRKELKLRYSQLLRFDSGSLSYLYPLGTEKFSSQPIRNLSVKVEVIGDKPLAAIYSPSHKVEIKRDGAKRALIGYEASNERPDTDFQLVFSPETDRGDLGVSLLSYREGQVLGTTHATGAGQPEAFPRGEGDGYFLLLAAPSFQPKDLKPAPKDVVFVLDSSGSMAGAKLAQAKKALGFCVENLNAQDRFEIVRFSTEAEPLFGKLLEASAANRKKAGEFIEGVKPMGGTAIADALEKALRLREKPSEPGAPSNPFVVVFLTDGLPTIGETSEEGILATVNKAGGNVRIFPFGIGSDVNTQLLDRMAETTRAFSQYVLANEDIEVKVSNFFTRIKEPALTNLRLEFAGADVKVSKLYPGELPDLFRGDQLVLVGRYSGSGKAEARLTANAAGREVKFSFPVEFAASNTDREFIPRLWATRRVGYLLDEIRLRGENAELREEVVSLAREYGIVTPYTAYLILEDESKRNVPLASQSLSEFGRDKDAATRSRDLWNDFKNEKSGGVAVGNARSQNLFKYADQAPAAITAGNSEAIGAVGAAQPALKAAADRIGQYAQQAKYVNGRAFFQNGNQWVDGRVQSLEKRTQLKFNSKEYYAFLGSHPESAPWLALGPNVVLAVGDTAYEVSE